MTTNRKLLGLRGQSLDGRKRVRQNLRSYTDVTTPGAGTFTAAADGVALAYLWGAGGSGRRDNANPNIGGGGGGSALFTRVPLKAGQTFAYSVGAGGAWPGVDFTDGNPGGDTTLTTLGGLIARARGGAGGVSGSVAGGVADGGELNRTGGAGGTGAASGGAGEFGGAGGNGESGPPTRGGGGGGAGFTDKLTLAPAPSLTGGNSSSPTALGTAGGSGGHSGAAGGNGRLLIFFVTLKGL